MAKKQLQSVFEERIQKRFPDESFTIIEYNGADGFLKIQCDNCKQNIEVNHAGNFLAKTKAYGCKNCHGLWKERERRLKIIQEKYEIISTQVKNTHTYYTIKCKVCGHERTSTLNNLYSHLDCGCVTGVYRLRSAEEFINEVNKLNDNEYELVGEYINQTTKVLLRHKPCGFIWKVWPSDMTNSNRLHSCPHCQRQESAGARYISHYLQQSGILFEKEVTIPNTRLRFDFFIPNLNCAIEYQGSQHYIPSSKFGGEERFKQQILNDNRKRDYCKNKQIKLVEIPYTYSKKQIKEELAIILQGSTTKVDQVIEKGTAVKTV